MTPASPGLLRALPFAAVAAYPLLGHDSLRRAAFVTLVVVCLGAAVAGLAANKLLRSRVWAMLLAGQLLLGAGNLTAAVDRAVTGGDGARIPADALRLLAYVLLVGGLLRLAGGRHVTREGGALLDATLVGTAATTVVGVFLLLPVAEDSSVTDPQRLAAVGCALAAVVALAALTRLVTARGARTPAFHLLAASVVAAVSATVGTMVAARAVDAPAWTVVALDMLAIAGHLLFALAALHPVVRAPATRDGGERLTAARLCALGGAMLLTPATLTIQLATGGPRHVPLVVVGSTCVIVLVLVRIRGLLRQVEDQAAQLSRMARADALTGLPNRRSWDFELARAASRARENGERLVVAVLDLDHFKAYNDSRGHQAGDELLRSAAAAWRDVLGRSGTLARYGGEEFALAVVGGRPGEPASGPDAVDDTVALLQRLAAVTPYGQTFSAGTAVWDFLEDPAEAVARADAALYEAKRAGRNRIVTADGSVVCPAVCPSGRPVGAPSAESAAETPDANRPNG